MDLQKVFGPNKQKLVFAVILFFVLPTLLFFEEEECGPWYSSYVDTKITCETESGVILIPFYGLFWLGVVFFDLSVALGEMLGSTIIHLILSYIVACLAVVFVLGKRKKTKEKRGE